MHERLVVNYKKKEKKNQVSTKMNVNYGPEQ